MASTGRLRTAAVVGLGLLLEVVKKRCSAGHPRTPCAPTARPLRQAVSGVRKCLRRLRVHVSHDGPDGRAYARTHRIEYPFVNDDFDAPAGASHPIDISSNAVCAESDLVGYEEPMQDRVVTCDALLGVSQRHVPVAIWLAGARCSKFPTCTDRDAGPPALCTEASRPHRAKAFSRERQVPGSACQR